ncbi:MAG: hypothetical protein V3T16_06680 [Gemmatimonadales bacterium]
MSVGRSGGSDHGRGGRRQLGNLGPCDGCPEDVNGEGSSTGRTWREIAADDKTLLPEEGTFERTSITYSVASDDPLVGQLLKIRLYNFNDVPGYEVDFDDFQLMVGDPCPWDLDGDGEVGITDFLGFLADWDNPYGINDFLALLANWGPCP